MMKKNREKGVSIVAAVGIMLILSILGIVAVSLLGSSSSLALDYLESQQAFYIAQAGMQWYLEKLENDTDWSNNTNESAQSFAGGSFAITVSNPAASSIDVTSTASVTGYENQAIQRLTHIHVTRTPAAFNNALYVGGNINSSGATDFVVTGGQQSGATDFPAVNFSYYQGIADHVVSGNKTFAAGTYSGIWYINGNVTINSNVTINGSIISTGNVDVKKVSNVTITASSPYPALVANGNFNFEESDNITVSGLIFVGADLSGNFLMQKAEDITFTGTVIVAGNFNVQNTDDVSITYNDAIIDNPPPGFTSTTGAPTTSDWQEVI